MLPDKIKKNPDGKVTLRIPSGTPLFTYLLLITLALIALAHFSISPVDDSVLARLGLSGEGVLDGQQYYRLMTALLLLATPASDGLGALLAGAGVLLVGLYTLHTVGVEMEQLWGSPRTVLVYTLGGAFGGAVTLLLVPLGLLPAGLPLATALGGVLAMVGAQVVYLFKHRLLYGAMAARRQAFLLVAALINLVLSAFTARADFIGVFFALLGGGVLAAFISPLILPRPHPDDPGALLAEDVNPLRARVPHVVGAMLVVMLVVAVAISLPLI